MDEMEFCNLGNGGKETRFVRYLPHPSIFEGAAAGAVLLGTVPQARAFREQFDWPDAVVDIPTGDRGVEQLFAQLDADPKRVHAIRAANVRHSLRRHDWCHRWRTILETIGMEPRPALSSRVESLNRAAAAFDPQPGGCV